MARPKLLIFVVAYNAEAHLEQTLLRIPKELLDGSRFDTELLVIDDASQDKTFNVGKQCAEGIPTLTVLKNPKNLGYGGNQKLGYRYALNRGFDFVALLHADGQYAPEKLGDLLNPLLNNQADAVFGSRMLETGAALRGGMPLYKFIGNKILTRIQNWFAGTSLSEYHSGYRAYACEALATIPFERNADYFDFDTDIILQLHKGGQRILEVPIPTFYGDEISHVDGVRYGLRVIRTCALFAVQKLGILYQAKFDLEQGETHYVPKFDFFSSHSLAHAAVRHKDRLLIFGAGPWDLVQPFLEKGCAATIVDLQLSPEAKDRCQSYQANIDEFDLAQIKHLAEIDRVLLLDVIEHLKDPEAFLERLRESKLRPGCEMIITTPNIAFFPIRCMLLLGFFHYGRRGILDRTHTRLFTFGSLTNMLQQGGYEILESRGIPAPFPLALGNNLLSRTLLTVNSLFIRLARSVFSYQLYFRVRSVPTVHHLLARTLSYSKELAKSEIGTK